MLARVVENVYWLSRYMVERVLYQSPRMVRGYVTGEDLMSTLKKIIDAKGMPTTEAGPGRGSFFSS